jgi:hypothetical protein
MVVRNGMKGTSMDFCEQLGLKGPIHVVTLGFGAIILILVQLEIDKLTNPI